MDPPRSTRGFPLFPLPIVALPGESVPLHVFEDRYRRMVERCLLAEPGSRACQVERVLERMPDGRLNILVRGTRRFRLLERQDDLPYPAGAVEFLDDEQDEQEDLEAAQAARELYAQLLERATDQRPAAEELSRMDAYAMAATVQFGCEAKQE